MLDPTYETVNESWYRYVINQIRAHGWEFLSNRSTAQLIDPNDVSCEQLVEFRFPNTTGTLELTFPTEESNAEPNLTLTYPFDPSFGQRTPRQDREPFVWALADAHEAIAERYISPRTRAYSSPDIILSADVPASLSWGELQETILGITLATVLIKQFHSSVFQIVDQYRSPVDGTTVETVDSAFGFERPN